MKDVVRRMHVDQLGKTFGEAFLINGDVICLMKRNDLIKKWWDISTTISPTKRMLKGDKYVQKLLSNMPPTTYKNHRQPTL
jgi:hypothetical protein